VTKGRAASALVVKRLEIADVKLVTPPVHHDARGAFCETFSKRALLEAGIDAEFVQDNYSISRPKWVVRGLHFQKLPHAQGKLIRVLRGSIFDVALDIRQGSPTYGRHVASLLSAENWAQLWVPEGFAHGFCTLEPDTEILYKVTDYYAPECDAGVRWDDPELGIAWPVSAAEAVLSDKDRELPAFKDLTPFGSRPTS
jgi:dTDP-4-dehydrorhamnose 3,5-epimerase